MARHKENILFISPAGFEISHFSKETLSILFAQTCVPSSLLFFQDMIFFFNTDYLPILSSFQIYLFSNHLIFRGFLILFYVFFFFKSISIPFKTALTFSKYQAIDFFWTVGMYFWHAFRICWNFLLILFIFFLTNFLWDLSGILFCCSFLNEISFHFRRGV